MSLWSDIQDRSAGNTVRKEDEVSENLWVNAELDIDKILTDLRQQQNQLKDMSRELLKRHRYSPCKEINGKEINDIFKTIKY